MKIKPIYKYFMTDMRNGLLVYYLVMLAIMLVNTIMLAIWTEDSSVSMSYEGCSMIASFVWGCIGFKEPFYLFSQNGSSRKSFYIARLLLMLSLGAALTVGDQLCYLIASFVNSLTSSYHTFSFFGGFDTIRGPISLALSFCMFLACYGLGAFISLVFFRLNTLGKVLVGAGVPILLFVGLPMLDAFAFAGSLLRKLAEVVIAIFSSAASIAIFFLIIAAVTMALVWLLTRRAIVKAK